MKSAIVAGMALLGTHLASADHYAPAYYQPTPAVVYDQPVVYQAPVVYTAPVVYNAPVVYQTVTPVAVAPVAVAPVAVAPVCDPVVYVPACPTPNVIIAGRGAYYSSWDSSPTVIRIGGGHVQHGSLPRRFR